MKERLHSRNQDMAANKKPLFCKVTQISEKIQPSRHGQDADYSRNRVAECNTKAVAAKRGREYSVPCAIRGIVTDQQEEDPCFGYKPSERSVEWLRDEKCSMYRMDEYQGILQGPLLPRRLREEWLRKEFTAARNSQLARHCHCGWS